jgi:hypothetical protein
MVTADDVRYEEEVKTRNAVPKEAFWRRKQTTYMKKLEKIILFSLIKYSREGWNSNITLEK